MQRIMKVVSYIARERTSETIREKELAKKQKDEQEFLNSQR